MRRTIIYFISALFFLFIINPIQAQVPYEGILMFENVRIIKQQDNLVINFNLELSPIHISNQAKVILTPVIKSDSLLMSQNLAPIIITGRTRDKVISRELALHNYEYQSEPQQYIVRTNNKEQSVVIKMSLPYSEWMRGAQLVLEEEATGCAECEYSKDSYLVVDKMLSPLFIPSYELLYVMPEAEEVKQRSETHSAYLNYQVGKYELIHNFENNAEILGKVNEIIREVRNDENLTFQTLTVTGYASPEGDYTKNMILSKNRAYSFVSYLEKIHGLNSSMIKVDWKGEDWDGLKEAISTSSIDDRNKVLNIIDENEDINQRKTLLKSLNGGSTYSFLLKSLYPPLRRNEYTISYVARPFSVDEAKEILKTKPQHLSLNEMFLVANTYPKDSHDFKEVFDIAVRLFPDDPIANLNVAAQEIEEGAINRAIERLQKIDFPEAYNNLGVAYAKREEYDKAAEYFNQAFQQGNETAKYNLEQMERFLEDR